MKKYFLILVIQFIFFDNIQAQIEVFISAKTGYAFNPSIEINNDKVINSGAFDMDLESTFKIVFLKDFYGEAGIGGRIIFASGKVNNLGFNSQTSRLLVPVRFGFQISEKWDSSVGLTFQNNIDLEGISLRTNYFFRMNFTLNGRFQFKNKWYLTGESSYSLRNIPDAFLINDPKFIIFAGLAKRF